jgi:hypothetical protein
LRKRGTGVSARSVGAEEGRAAGVFAGAFWLARKEMRRARPSYPLGGLLLVLFGLFVVPSLSGVYGAHCAMLSVLAGGMAFALLAWATGGRLKRWDLSA